MHLITLYNRTSNLLWLVSSHQHGQKYKGNYVQAGLVLHQSYVPEKCRTNGTKNPHLQQCISWGLGD